MRLIIECDPKPCGRPRFANGRCYLSEGDLQFREHVGFAAKEKFREPMDGALELKVKIYRQWEPTSRRFGDLDNHLKGILDALNGILYRDDAQIVRCVCEKYRDEKRPRLEIEVKRK